MNHSCSPNVLWQQIAHDKMVYGVYSHWIFRNKKDCSITELRYDYGASRGGGKKIVTHMLILLMVKYISLRKLQCEYNINHFVHEKLAATKHWNNNHGS